MPEIFEYVLQLWYTVLCQTSRLLNLVVDNGCMTAACTDITHTRVSEDNLAWKGCWPAPEPNLAVFCVQQ